MCVHGCKHICASGKVKETCMSVKVRMEKTGTRSSSCVCVGREVRRAAAIFCLLCVCERERKIESRSGSVSGKRTIFIVCVHMSR